ncbi:hypothetical protein TNCV_4067161 [Trichonephila clavipes]|nr:hypothetical protein TNCV_4067161 [Trichonephila clavipes]
MLWFHQLVKDKCLTHRLSLNFLRSTSCGMTGTRGHGAIVYCLNSGSEVRQTGRHNSEVEPAPAVWSYARLILTQLMKEMCYIELHATRSDRSALLVPVC